MLVEHAQRLMRECKRLVEQREAHARQLERFVDERGTVKNDMLIDASDYDASLRSSLCRCASITLPAVLEDDPGKEPAMVRQN